MGTDGKFPCAIGSFFAELVFSHRSWFILFSPCYEQLSIHQCYEFTLWWELLSLAVLNPGFLRTPCTSSLAVELTFLYYVFPGPFVPAPLELAPECTPLKPSPGTNVYLRTFVAPGSSFRVVHSSSNFSPVFSAGLSWPRSFPLLSKSRPKKSAAGLASSSTSGLCPSLSVELCKAHFWHRAVPAFRSWSSWSRIYLRPSPDETFCILGPFFLPSSWISILQGSQSPSIPAGRQKERQKLESLYK